MQIALRRIYLSLALLLVAMFGYTSSPAQILSGAISLSPKDTTICPGQTITLYGGFSYGDGGVRNDDVFADTLLNIGFPFVYYGAPYTKCIYGPNAFISFDTTLAGSGFSSWIYPTALASGDIDNAILLPFQDLLITSGGVASSQIQGQAPFRRFILELCKIPQFRCTSNLVTSQLVLYETTNIIEIHIGNQPSCPNWNGGTQIEGLRGLNGTAQNLAPGRDLPNVPWTATNDGRRWTPVSPTAYKMDTIPYAPNIIIPNADSNDIIWYEPNNPIPIGVGPHITVTPTANIGYYIAEVSGTNGCLGTQNYTFRDTVFIHYGSSQTNLHQEICAGSSFNWMGQTLFAPGYYDTTLHSYMGCDSLLRLELVLNPLPDVSLKGPAKLEICDGSSSTIALLNPARDVSYQWNKERTPIVGETASEYTARAAGNYNVAAVSSKGCTATSPTVNLVVHPNPEAQIQPLDNNIHCTYDTVALTAAEGQSYDYQWAPAKPFRIVTGAEGRKVKGIFADPSTEVILTVFNEYGCSDKDSTLVQAKPCCEVFVPNVFTPNGDGLNDYFSPSLMPAQILLTFKVYDREGKRVYNNEDMKHGWNGRYPNGEEANQGVYMYFVEYTCADGKIYTKKNDVTLIR